MLSFTSSKTAVLSRAFLPGGEDWIEKPLGKGRILFAAFPLELNDNLEAIGDVYKYALKIAGVSPVYTATLKDPGILICPTQYPDATLLRHYLRVKSEQVDFKDVRSGREFAGTLASGRAAILLVGADGKLLAALTGPLSERCRPRARSW